MRFKWTNEMLIEEALKYDTRKKFEKGNNKAYQASYKKGILDDICSHMIGNIKWSYEMLREEAFKYNTRNDFSKGNWTGYVISHKRGILDDICSHMVRQGNKYERFIYTIKFENNSIYIGLTSNLEKRKYAHIKKSSNRYVREFINNNIKYEFNSDNILYTSENASKKECFLIRIYEEMGYKVLNISKGGGLGGDIKKWTVEMIIEEALKYNKKKYFLKGSPGAHSAAVRIGILNNVCEHMISNRWSEEIIKEEALKYSTRSDFQKGNRCVYEAANRRGILDDICSHMSLFFTKWTEEILREEALKHNNRNDFHKNSKGAYLAAKRRGILDNICRHMYKEKKHQLVLEKVVVHI